VHIRFRVNAASMKHVCRRVSTRLANHSKKGAQLIAFKIGGKSVEIAAHNSRHGVEARVQRGGSAFIPHTVLHGVIITLPYFGRRSIDVGFSTGKMCVDNMVFHDPMIGCVSSVRRSPSKSGFIAGRH